MTAFVLILLVLGEIVFVVMFSGIALGTTKFRFPIILIAAISMLVSSVLVAVQFWWLFGVWYNTYVLGAVGLAAAFLVVALFLQIVSNTLNADKNARANVLSILSGQTNQGLFIRLFSFVAGVAAIVVIWKAYALTWKQLTPEVIKDATFLYFTIGAMPGLVLMSLQATANALNRTVDSVVRNILAINSLGAYALAAWRAAFPFIFISDTTEVLGYQLNVYVVLGALGAIYAIFVIIPLLAGARLYTEERESLMSEAMKLLNVIATLREANLTDSAFDGQRRQLAASVNDTLVRVFENDPLLRFLAFWRWAPDQAFNDERGYWVLGREPYIREKNPEFHQPLGVLQRNWFKILIGDKQRVKRNIIVEKTAIPFLRQIPSWNYRAAIFDELVPVLEDLEGNQPREASATSKMALARISHGAPTPAGRSVITAFLMALFSMIGSVSLSAFEGQIKTVLQGVLKVMHGGG